MAKTYLEVDPDASISIFDSAVSVGGVWAKERLYPGLKTNNLLGTYEFSDFPMKPERFDVKPRQHIPGEVVHEYLTQFAKHFNLMPRMCLAHKVESAELLTDGSWLICIVSTGSEQCRLDSQMVVANRLVVATGLTSNPYVPTFTGQENFNRDLFHAKELRHRVHELERVKHVIVLGGNKSAWDTCYFAANTGANVHMIMRPGGGGPSWVWPVVFSLFQISIQRLATTRFFTWFDPCIWSEEVGPVGWIRYALHRTLLGRKIVFMMWRILEWFAHRAYHYDEHPETRKLKPWVSPFWMGNSLSIHNYTSSWLDLVRHGNITIHIADIDYLSEGNVHLSNGEDLEADIFVCCTGWVTQPSIRFLPEKITPMLGLKHHASDNRQLAKQAHTEILARLPAVQEPLRRNLPPGTVTSSLGHSSARRKNSSRYRLYRFLVPPSLEISAQRNIAFIGAHLALNAIPIAQMQALWITAFFMDEIPHLKPDLVDRNKVGYETILHNEYSAIRHPCPAGGAGGRCPDLAFDCLSYVDLLMDDLGLEKYRKHKKGGIWSETFHRYSPSDYKGIVHEWLNQTKTTNDSL